MILFMPWPLVDFISISHFLHIANQSHSNVMTFLNVYNYEYRDKENTTCEVTGSQRTPSWWCLSFRSSTVGSPYFRSPAVSLLSENLFSSTYPRWSFYLEEPYVSSIHISFVRASSISTSNVSGVWKYNFWQEKQQILRNKNITYYTGMSICLLV